jgi:hypothetical protein
LVSDIKSGTYTEVFENRVRRRIFLPKRYEVMGGWKQQDNEELHKLYSSPNTIKRSSQEDEIGRACGTKEGGLHIGQWRGKPEGKRPLGR